MNTYLKKHLNLIKKAVIFILCCLILSSLTTILFYSFLRDWIAQLDEKQIREILNNPIEEIARTSFNMYIITYILFRQLPEKIKSKNIILKGINFILFYIFCWIVYIWI